MFLSPSSRPSHLSLLSIVVAALALAGAHCAHDATDAVQTDGGAPGTSPNGTGPSPSGGHTTDSGSTGPGAHDASSSNDAGGHGGTDAPSEAAPSVDGGSSFDSGTPFDSGTAFDAGTPVEAGSPGPVDVTFTIQSTQNAHAISPYVYGINDDSSAASTRPGMVRAGGNRFTAYNWENNASNAGSDYYFENDDYLCLTVTCLPNSGVSGAYAQAFVGEAAAAGAAALLTVPIVDYVAADKSPPGDVRSSGSNYLQTRFHQNVAAKGAPFVLPPDTTDGFVYQDEFAYWVSQTMPSANVRFLLDNEPDLWSSTHAEVHPVAVTYDELKTRSIAYATALKAVLPNVQVWGPVSYGWEGYVNLQNAVDAPTYGDFVNYYLDQMNAAGQAAGKRLVDGLDLHWYPEATGDGQRIIVPGATPGLVAAREQAPRSLWDTTYTENSWITQYSTMGPIFLISRMQDKITQHYPGTGLSFSEWNYGGGGDISGAIASADVLGIFGRDGVDMSMMFPINSDESFTYTAFRAFRNYDGAGKAFGDTSISATTTDVPDSSVYASVDAANPSRMVIVAINKALTSLVAGISISHSTVYSTANVYTVTAGGGANVVASGSISAVATNAFRYTMPAQSISVLEPAP